MARRALASLLLAAGLLAGATVARAGLAPRYGGALSVALPAAPLELDPARAATSTDLQVARALHATLVDLEPNGALRPALLESLPEAEPGGRAWRLRLRPGLRFHDGRPVTAADVAASLTRLVAVATRSPHGWIAMPLQGVEEVRDGRAASLAGVQVISDLELRLLLHAPFPELPRSLAAAPAAILPKGGPATTGAGPFQLGTRGRDGILRLLAFDGFWRGRAYADALGLGGMDARRAARATARDELDLSLRPEALGAASRELPPLTATYAVVNLRRLGRAGIDIRRALASLDRAELVRLSGRARAVPLPGLLPPALLAAEPGAARSAPAPGSGAGGGAPGPAADASPAPPPIAAPAGPGATGRAAPARLAGSPALSIVLVGGAESARAVADRLQVKLFDRGVRASVDPVAPEVLASRLASGNFDLALANVTFAASGPQGGVLEVAWALGGPAGARQALARLAASADAAEAAAEVADDLGAVPLHVSGLTASARPALEGLAVRPDGTIDPGDLWLAPLAAR